MVLSQTPKTRENHIAASEVIRDIEMRNNQLMQCVKIGYSVSLLG